jgi:NAD(P)-dependent dehydrogenase (short-subunit alcohol dehydrogenase family)
LKESAPTSLHGKVALITGCGGGIGRAMARAAHLAGATVIVAGRTQSSLDDIAGEIHADAVRVDVADESEVRRLFATIVARYGRLDILFNNAGIPGPIMPLAEMDLALWDECISINLRGAMLCMKEAARIMTAQRAGVIINTSSLFGLQGSPMRTAYCATKFALIGMTQALARELGPVGVRVNALCPGSVQGALMDDVIARRAAAESKSSDQIVREYCIDDSALGRLVAPGEVAAAALFLAGDSGSAITGESLRVDAGRV